MNRNRNRTAQDIRRITTREELVELARELGVRDDWHEPDEQDLAAKVFGSRFDNSGDWAIWTETADQELHVIIYRTQQRAGRNVPVEPVAAVNIATLLAWATGYEGEG